VPGIIAIGSSLTMSFVVDLEMGCIDSLLNAFYNYVGKPGYYKKVCKSYEMKKGFQTFVAPYHGSCLHESIIKIKRYDVSAGSSKSFVRR
jgi:hypothetical protein